MKVDQLGLLLWKNYIVRKRSPGILTLIFAWPVVVFLILFTVRDNIDPEYNPTCQFPARAMPQDGLLPFVQSFICSIGNPCDPLEDYEDVPSYKNASLGSLVMELQPMLTNDTILSAIGTLPKSIQLLKSMAQILTKPEVKALFDRGIQLGDLFNNHLMIKDLLKAQLPEASEDLIDGLFDSSIKLVYLIETFGSSNVDGVVCSPESLKKYLILVNEDDYEKISSILCNIDPNDIPDILESLSKHLDFSGLLAMVDRAMAKFRDYDFFDDLKRAALTILNLETTKKYVPNYLKIQEWLPSVIMIFKNVTFKEIDLTVINKTLDVLQPIFEKTRGWPIARRGLTNLDKLLVLVKAAVKRESNDEPSDFFSTIDQLSGNLNSISSLLMDENITKILDASFLVLQDGIRLTNKLLTLHESDIEVAAEIMDSLKSFFSENVVNSITYVVSLINNIVKITHHVAVVHENTLSNIFQVTKRHEALVKKMLINFTPVTYRAVIQSFSKLDFLERMVEAVKNGPIEDYICENPTLIEIFGIIQTLEGESDKVKDLLCNEDGKKFIADIYESFNFKGFGEIITNTLSTLVMTALSSSVPIERSNLTTVARSIKSFMNYLEEAKPSDPEWTRIFEISDDWRKVFKETQVQGRVDILGIHLSIAKSIGYRSLSYMTIKPHLENMDVLGEMILQNLQANSSSWIEEVRDEKYNLIEAFYLTASDKEKSLKILEFSNFTRVYCDLRNPPTSLLNFPKGSNEQLLKNLTCRIARSVQAALELNVTDIEFEESTYRRKKSFNWTDFNEKIMQIYYYIDSIVHSEKPNGGYDMARLEVLRKDFAKSWTKDLNMKDAWEISVGLICKLFDVMEMPLFKIQAHEDWRNMYAVAWVASVIFENIERVVDQIQENGHSLQPTDLLYELPQTEILLNVLLRNLSPIILDTVDLVKVRLTGDLFSVLEEYRSQEEKWPCINNVSVGKALGLRFGSQEAVREIERIACNPGLFIKEWKEQPILTKARKLFQKDATIEFPAFNWTLGYGKFRRFLDKFDLLINDTRRVVLQEYPDLDGSSPVTEVRTLDDPEKFEERTVLDYLDSELDRSIEIFRSEMSLRDIWKARVTLTDRLLAVLKFTSHVLHELRRLVFSIVVDEHSDKLSLLSLAGFTNGTVVSIFYNQFPYVLSTIFNGLSDPTVSELIGQRLNTDKPISCENIFDWWRNSSIGLSSADYDVLMNFICHLDPENFNAYTNLFVTESTIWRSPMKSYKSRLASAFLDFYHVFRTVKRLSERNVTVKMPYSVEYFHLTASSMLESLSNQTGVLFVSEHMNLNSILSTYKLSVEGVSEILLKMADALNDRELKDGVWHTWDLIRNSDVRQLVKIVEAHPEEAIALMASLATISPATGKLISPGEVRKTICGSHFGSSDYWNHRDRIKFLKDICSFDPYQLMETATSSELADVVLGETSILHKTTPISFSMIKLLEAGLNIESGGSKFMMKSNVINATTWKKLKEETWSIIRKAEESWIHWVLAKTNQALDYSKLDSKADFISKNTRGLVDSSRIFQILDFLADIFTGGDLWQKLRTRYEGSKIKPLLNLIEDIPNLLITTADTFLSSEKLGDFIEKLVQGQVDPCDIDKYLNVPAFMRKKGLLSTITNFCKKIALKTNSLSKIDFMPIDLRSEERYMIIEGKSELDGRSTRVFNESFLLEKLYQLESTLIRASLEGFRTPKYPFWWTSFEEGTLKDFNALYKSKDSRELAHSIVKKTTGLIKNLLKNTTNNQDCSWCSTLMIEIINSQLSMHSHYADLMCKMKRLNSTELEDILLRDFYWNKTVSMLKDYKYLNKRKTLDEFVDKIEDSLRYMADIIVDFQNETYKERVTECYEKFMGRPNPRPGLYVLMMIAALDTLQRNINIVDTRATHAKITKLTRLAEKSVPIWKPLAEVTKKAEQTSMKEFLPEAMINVNAILNDRERSLCHTKRECQNSTVLYNYLVSKRAGKVLRYDAKAAKYPGVLEIADRLSRTLDLERIDWELSLWRQDASWELYWLKQILQHLSIVLEESGNLLDVASKIDFEDVSNLLGVPDLADGVVNILKDKTVDKVFDGMKELVEDVEPFISDPEVIRDLYSMITALESMEIFKNLGLLDMRYLVKDMFDDWEQVRTYLSKKLGFSKEVSMTLSQAKVDMISVFLKERRAVSLKDTVCSPEKLADMLSFEQTKITAEEVSQVFCKLDDATTQNISIALIKNLNFDYIFRNLMSANVKNILSNANLTEAEGKQVMDNIGVASELLPLFKDRLSSSLTAPETEESETDEPVSSSQFLHDSSEMLCGRTMMSDSGEFYKIISSIEDNSQIDQRELDSLPTKFCKDTYKSVQAMPGGKIVWSYVKPLLRGQILYAPDTVAVGKVMKVANETFVQMEHFGQLMNSFVNTLTSLANLSEMSDSLRELQDVMSSDVMKIAIKSLAGGKFEGDFSELNLSEISWRLKKSKKMINMVEMLADLIDCVLVNRVRGFGSEEELEAEAAVLTETNEFLAGVVFLQDESVGSRDRRSTDQELPDEVSYKIRMDVDYVPSTRRLKTQFWLPGPESSFIEDLRYLRGFIQLQDSVDRGIIKVKADKEYKWITVTNQMPYPCWKFVPFQRTLYESQGLQMCFFFALMMVVGSAVRHIVWERESRNSMVMSVMGLKPWRNTCAWFITSYIELLIVMISIGLILLVGQILPKSDPLLVMLLLANYIFSIATFCYMISTIFSSASLAAVTAVVMFLLTYMPYIIVIAMEAAMGLGYKLIICLSMSTSFCYGCLYAARKEVQGDGLQWSNMWEESSPGDPMSLGLVFIMMTIDALIYALIGYLTTKYTNSDQDFCGLRSSSLWWSNSHSLYGKSNYSSYVNSLYFTNDVLHPTTTYKEDDSDVSSLTVSKKQIGVSFEGIGKVYHTSHGDIVAVDDFNLKLCEGEVTSLLGRNGAGKTTIIKMLTGMVTPSTGEISLNGEEGCKPDIGVCPQENVLIGSLTPREHMIFYAKLKGSKDAESLSKSVDNMMTSLELGRQEHEPVSRLSGGTKRRLCVALAFLGSPKLVILDEPGAGVDPAARRRIWKLIDQNRIGRTVLLSTHHLDEADMLSDTVVFMHRGKILCSGSPQYLKMTYGQGYDLHVSFPPGHLQNKHLENIQSTAKQSVDNAVVKSVAGSEVVLTLPFKDKHGYLNDLERALKSLEGNQETLGYTRLTLECDTLEKVFLDLCGKADSGSNFMKASLDSVASVDQIGLSIPEDDIDLINNRVNTSSSPSAFRQAKALLKKRLWHFAKDWRAPLSALILPTMFVAVAMGFSLIRPPSEDEPPLNLNPKLYDIHPTYFYSIDQSKDQFLQQVSIQLHDQFGDDYSGAWQTTPNDTGVCECTEGQQTCRDNSQAMEGLLQILPGRQTLDWIVTTHLDYIEKRYGGWTLSHHEEDPLFVVWYNNKGHHALPSYLNAMNEAILRASGFDGRINTYNHPLKLSSDQLNRTSLLQHVADVGVALVLLIAFSLVGAQGAKELVRERLSEEKRILYLAGVHPITYWTTALIWDMIVFLASIALAVMVFEIFGLPAYVERENLAGTCLLLFLYAWAAIPFSHLAEKTFDDSSLSNMVLFCVNTFIGVVCLATILVIDILGKSEMAQELREFLHKMFMILPQYALGDALIQLSRNDITAELLTRFHMNTYQSPLGWDLLGLHFVSLAMVGGILFVVNLIIESRLLPEVRKRKVVYEVVEEDDDVAKERARVESGQGNDPLKTLKLRKEYRSVYGTNVAVQNLSFGVQAGKCFGLLGVNGAGKSTTFKMLTTEVIPTAGSISLRGAEIGKGPLCNGDVGYCPQTDALDGFLTPHQCLTIHAEVSGLHNVPRAVSSMLKCFDLQKYAHQRVDSLSGGNKRKLCAAISMMAPVSVVLMDEPTSGMDPATKALVAKAIQGVTKNQSCVILTSHSVAECENICSRVGILAKAGLRCIGTPQHLKHKFGEGYVAFVRFEMPVSGKDLRRAVTELLPNATISSRQASTARILIPWEDRSLKLSTIFARVKQLASKLNVTDFTLTQSSLDQVLVSFSEELEEETPSSQEKNGQSNLANFPNAYSNMDTIHLETF
ncbi:uncharacterized protein ldd isoform X2 [Prorops nasuta]